MKFSVRCKISYGNERGTLLPKYWPLAAWCVWLYARPARRAENGGLDILNTRAYISRCCGASQLETSTDRFLLLASAHHHGFIDGPRHLGADSRRREDRSGEHFAGLTRLSDIERAIPQCLPAMEHSRREPRWFRGSRFGACLARGTSGAVLDGDASDAAAVVQR